MKKKEIIVIVCITILLGSIIMITSYQWLKSRVENPKNNQLEIPNPTYQFIGQSKHFEFSTGKVYYGPYSSELVITDFRQTKSISNLQKISVTILFNDIIWEKRTNESSKSKKFMNDLLFYESTPIHQEFGVSNSFRSTKEETFKKSIVVRIDYCTKNGSCKRETMHLSYQ